MKNTCTQSPRDSEKQQPGRNKEEKKAAKNKQIRFLNYIIRRLREQTSMEAQQEVTHLKLHQFENNETELYGAESRRQ